MESRLHDEDCIQQRSVLLKDHILCRLWSFHSMITEMYNQASISNVHVCVQGNDDNLSIREQGVL